jgi:hypothetical protein
VRSISRPVLCPAFAVAQSTNAEVSMAWIPRRWKLAGPVGKGLGPISCYNLIMLRYTSAMSNASLLAASPRHLGGDLMTDPHSNFLHIGITDKKPQIPGTAEYYSVFPSSIPCCTETSWTPTMESVHGPPVSPVMSPGSKVRERYRRKQIHVYRFCAESVYGWYKYW